MQLGPTLPAQLYDSLPLPPGSRSIRLLDLEALPPEPPSRKGQLAEDDPEPLQGRLRVVSLAGSPRFAALSYVWGDPAPDPRNVIRCGTCSLPLTQSCADALRVIRRRAGQQTLAIWVDALCINQADAAEKADQILLMEEIYQWADPVLVWLGRATEGSDRAFFMMRWTALNDTSRRSTQSLPWMVATSPSEKRRRKVAYSWKYTAAFWTTARLKGLPKLSKWYGRLNPGWVNKAKPSYLESARKSFQEDQRDVLSRPWFFRAWTFQELVLAVNPVLLCGSSEIAWIDFVSALDITIPDIFATSVACAAGTVWMNIPRPTKWNGQPIRASLLPPPPPRVPARLHRSNRKSDTDSEVGEQALLPEPDSRFSFRAYLEGTSRCPRVPKNPGPAHCHCSSTATTLARVLWLLVLLTPYLAVLIPIAIVRTVTATAVFIVLSVFGGLLIYLFVESVLGNYVQDACVVPLIEGQVVAGRVLDSTGVVVRGMMQQLRERHATHPNDKAYALYGILKTVQVDKLAPVDYSQPRGKVYHPFFSSLLSWDVSLVCLLLDANGGSLGTDMPTWVPDWSTPCRANWLDSSYTYFTRATSPAGSAPPQAAVVDHRLTVTGILYDACVVSFACFIAVDEAEIVAGLDPASPTGQAILELYRWISRARHDIRLDSALESTPKAIATVLRGSELGDVEDVAAREKEEQEFSEWYRVFSDACETGGRDDRAVVAAATTAMAANERARGYFLRCCGKLAGKRGLFLTSKGYIGTGPVVMLGSESSLEGDVLALVAGAAAPLVLRSRGNGEYSVVGPALIPGVMEGEAWEREGGQNAAQDIVLV